MQRDSNKTAIKKKITVYTATVVKKMITFRHKVTLYQMRNQVVIAVLKRRSLRVLGKYSKAVREFLISKKDLIEVKKL